MTILPVAYLGSVEYFARILAGGCTIDLGEHYVKRSQRNRTRILSANGPLALSVQLCRANRPRTPVREIRIDYSKRWQHQHWVALMSAYRASPYFDYYAGQLEPFYRRRYEFLADYDLELTAMLLRLLGDKPMPALSERYIEAGPADLDLRDKARERVAWGLQGGQATAGAPSTPCVAESVNGRTSFGRGAFVRAPLPVPARPLAPVQPLRLPAQTQGKSADSAPSFVEETTTVPSVKKYPDFAVEPYYQLFSERMPFVGNLSVIDLLFAEGPSSPAILRRCLR